MAPIVARSGTTRLAVRRNACAVAIATACAVALPAQADDIDVYEALIAARKAPNVLFVLDFSGSMNQGVDGSGYGAPEGSRKIDMLRTAMAEVLADDPDDPRKIRAGIGSIYAEHASGVRWPISDPEAPARDIDPSIPADTTLTARDVMLGQLERRGASGNTRTVNALLEAAMYFGGGAVLNGGNAANDPDLHTPDVWDPDTLSYAGGNSRAAITASYVPADGEASPGHYRSPIGGQCDSNVIVLISDGLPDKYDPDPALAKVIGMDPTSCEDLRASVFAGESPELNGDCGPELVRALATNDAIAGIPGSTIKTYTVGFGISGAGEDYLKLLADAGRAGNDQKSGYYSAADETGLKNALAAIKNDVTAGTESFVELSVDVDKASFSHDDRAYFNLFMPSERSGWSGNLKGYHVGADGFTDLDGADAIVTDIKGTRFAATARSFWSASADGNDVLAGGASARLAARLASAPRNLYTYLGDPTSIGAGGIALAQDSANELDPTNAAILPEHFGVGTSADTRTAALAWLQTAPIGDPLHSKSVSVSYDSGNGDGMRQVVYVMTNQGLLHAIDATDAGIGGGEELFAFMPKRLLPNLPSLATNRRVGPHIYGLDGPTTRWHDDANNDGIVNGTDTVMLVFGMRRGGDAYYALDVTDPAAPRLEWAIDSGVSGFAELAQSWSRASLVRVRRGDEQERVLVFGGGYDPALDGTGAPTHSRGNAVFVVDRDGGLVRKFTHDKMDHALAADLTVIDSDADGLADRLYAGDLGGQVWRIDFDDIAADAGSRVTRLATLADGGHQPFFSAPSVALERSAAGDFLSIALGSGDRTEPLDPTSGNAFFVLRDTEVDKGPSSVSPPIEVKDLHDATSDRISSTDPAEASKARQELANARGWLVRLAPGEKSLSRIVSFEGQLLATTFAPGAGAGDGCSFETTRRFYRLDLSAAAPLIHTDGDGDAPNGDGPRRRWRALGGGGIPSAPVVLFPKGSGTVQIIVDREYVDAIEQRLTRVYWHAK